MLISRAIIIDVTELNYTIHNITERIGVMHVAIWVVTHTLAQDRGAAHGRWTAPARKYLRHWIASYAARHREYTTAAARY